MIVINDDMQNIMLQDETCVALGTFDGIHLGHQALIKEAVNRAKEKNMKSVVLTFDVLPMTVISPDNHPGIILENRIKTSIIEKMGVDYLIYLKFTMDFAMTEGEKFLSFLTEKLNARMLICGYNYSFGKYGSGNGIMLEEYKDRLGYELKVFSPVKCGSDDVSSTLIRERLVKGEVEEASRLLGYTYFYEGRVENGFHIGSSMGFPTANLYLSDDMVIRNGIYITYTYVDNVKYPSVCNIGHAPTFEKKQRAIEVFLFNFNGSLYGKDIKTEFLNFIRPEIKFSSKEKLSSQISSDVLTAKKYFKIIE